MSISRSKRLALAAPLAVTAALALAGVAAAKTPYQYVAPLRDAARNGTDQVEAAIVSNQANAGPVSYADAFLQSVKNGLGQVDWAPQLFSDRRYSSGAPFNSAMADQLGVRIGVNDTAQTVSATFDLHSWGDTTETLKNLRMEDGILVGDGVGNHTPYALFAISLKPVPIPG